MNSDTTRYKTHLEKVPFGHGHFIAITCQIYFVVNELKLLKYNAYHDYTYMDSHGCNYLDLELTFLKAYLTQSV